MRVANLMVIDRELSQLACFKSLGFYEFINYPERYVESIAGFFEVPRASLRPNAVRIAASNNKTSAADTTRNHHGFVATLREAEAKLKVADGRFPLEASDGRVLAAWAASPAAAAGLPCKAGLNLTVEDRLGCPALPLPPPSTEPAATFAMRPLAVIGVGAEGSGHHSIQALFGADEEPDAASSCTPPWAHHLAYCAKAAKLDNARLGYASTSSDRVRTAAGCMRDRLAPNASATTGFAKPSWPWGQDRGHASVDHYQLLPVLSALTRAGYRTRVLFLHRPPASNVSKNERVG